MAGSSDPDKRFGDIAIDMQLMTKENLHRALVVQKLILNRSKIHMAIGKVLKEMGVLTQEQVDSVLEAQAQLNTGDNDEDCGCRLIDIEDNAAADAIPLAITLPKDKLSAFISPTKACSKTNHGVTLGAVKELLNSKNVVSGLVDDQRLSDYLSQAPLPANPFKVAQGTPPASGKPSEIIYHFDTDPLRIGTLQHDGTMDWKARGEIPVVKAGDILAEKTQAVPGRPGTTVCGKELAPPRMRKPKLKGGKGTRRSEDGNQILAKVEGTPKLSSNGKVFVFSVLHIDSDIGIETGHMEYDGYIESTGGVQSGYTVRSKGLRTADIQDATIETEEDLVCDGGIYGSTIKVGGNMKASHIHNCTVDVLGELVVEKEIYDSTIETNSRCLIVEGKIIDTKVDAKKGIYAKDIGSQGSNPCVLTIGYDRQYERDMGACKTEKDQLTRQLDEAGKALPEADHKMEALSRQISEITQEQEKFMLQQRQFEEQLRGEGPNPMDEDDEEERAMLEEMIAELKEKNDELDARVRALIAEEGNARRSARDAGKRINLLEAHIEKINEKMELLKASHEVDPAVAQITIHGTIFNKTEIIGPHKEMGVAQDMTRVRIAETKVDPDGNRYQLKISNLR
jgi:uncharacterized protein (DUF342 family)